MPSCKGGMRAMTMDTSAAYMGTVRNSCTAFPHVLAVREMRAQSALAPVGVVGRRRRRLSGWWLLSCNVNSAPSGIGNDSESRGFH